MSEPKNRDERAHGAAQDTLRDSGKGIYAPRLTPQGRTSPDGEGEDETFRTAA